MKKSYVMIHLIKHDMDPNSNINYRRKIGPMNSLDSQHSALAILFPVTKCLCQTS